MISEHAEQQRYREMREEQLLEEEADAGRT
jgi:hypothetical protein